MNVPVKVLGARLVVKVDKPEEVAFGGIVIPDASKESANRGVVIAVGDGARLENGTHFPMEVAVGDHVIFNQNAGAPIEAPGYEEDELKVLNERDILAIVEKE